nr:helix-turn-helix domain-containing protein [Pseudomonas sp.]
MSPGLTPGFGAAMNDDEPADFHREPSGSFIAPLGRALAILSSFPPQERWLAVSDIALRTRTPVSTAARLLKSLAVLGYVRHCEQRRKYRLTAAVLSLGYAANTNTVIQQAALGGMRALAQEGGVCVVLGSRDRLDVVVLESCRAENSQRAAAPDPAIPVGTRLSLAESPMGWALLAALPKLEHQYLLDSLERRQKREWPRVRRRLSEAIFQVHEKGFCTSLSEWDSEISVVAAPLMVQGRAPMAVACIGHSAKMTRASIERNLGPRLIGLVEGLQEAGFLEEHDGHVRY